jgi:hypothetical protein
VVVLRARVVVRGLAKANVEGRPINATATRNNAPAAVMLLS